MRRLDIGIASFGSPDRLVRTINGIKAMSACEWRCFIIHNPGGERDAEARGIIGQTISRDARFIPIWNSENLGYAGAVCRLMELAETEYVAYCDNDVEINTQGWDEKLAGYLDRFHEIGMIFPCGGAYRIKRPAYTEILWGVGFCWMISRLCMKDVGGFDTSLGHQEEADYAQRVRMAGYKCASADDVHVAHCATATSNPASIERINRGVVNWVNKWNAYFNGKSFNYHSQNVTRFEDWPPNALYLEEYWREKLPGLNDAPEVRRVGQTDYDLIKVPRLSGFYRGRII